MILCVLNKYHPSKSSQIYLKNAVKLLREIQNILYNYAQVFKMS